MPNLKPGIRTCIWCLQQKYFSSKPGTGSQFNKEHVIPESFGSFKHALTLVGLVCTDCNDLFGKSLDATFGRGGYEGYLRLKHGQKPAHELPQYNSSSSRMIVHQPDQPVWHGAEVILTEDGSSIFETTSQVVAFRSTGSKHWIRLTENQLDSIASLRELALELPAEMQLLALAPDVKERIIKKLKEKGAECDNWDREIPNGEAVVLGSFEVDETRQRALTKIALNYLAKVFEISAPQLLYSECLLPAKRFVMSGIFPGYPVVLKGAPIHAIHNGHKITNGEGHLISLGFGNFQGRSAIMCQVSLYNQITLLVTVCADYRGIILPTRSAHFWCLADMTCRRVAPLDAESRLPLPFVSSQF